jgi:hypothetical protein
VSQLFYPVGKFPLPHIKNDACAQSRPWQVNGHFPALQIGDTPARCIHHDIGGIELFDPIARYVTPERVARDRKDCFELIGMVRLKPQKSHRRAGRGIREKENHHRTEQNDTGDDENPLAHLSLLQRRREIGLVLHARGVDVVGVVHSVSKSS